MTKTTPTVLWTNLDDSAVDLRAYLHWLDKTERERSRALVLPVLFGRFVGAHLFLRAALSRFLLCQPDRISFVHTEYGKPLVANGPDFNLSHSGPFTALAVGGDVALGLDIEAICPHRTRFIRCMLTEREKQQLACISSSAEDMLQLWVRKEAVMKATSLGMRLDPAKIQIGIFPPSLKLWQSVDVGRSISTHVIDLDLGPDLLGALAIVGSSPSFFPAVQNCELVDLMDATRELA